MSRMDEKLGRIRAGRYTKSDFIIADAKDADMGSGATGLGPRRDAQGAALGWRNRAEFIEQIEAVIRDDQVDIMLVSASILERLHARKAFADSNIQPAIRANDATDCWGAIRHSNYAHHPSRPFRSANLAQVMYGKRDPDPQDAITGTDLGLYSVTFVNDLDLDLRAQHEYARFRDEAGALGFRHFLEVFKPNVKTAMDTRAMGEFVNDCILRCLAGVMQMDRPQFLKMPYNGPRAMDELASFDPTLVVGVLGGGAGTTRDAFELVAQAERYGARLALFGRKINLAESQEQMIRHLRRVVQGDLSPAEAVRSYHSEIGKLGLAPLRPLDEDIDVTEAPLREGAAIAAKVHAGPGAAPRAAAVT